MMNIIKFSALAFATNEYFAFAKEEMLTLEAKRLKRVYNLDECSRATRKKVEKKIKLEFDKYVSAFNNWERMLQKLVDTFDKDEQMKRMTDFSIDLLHRSLDKFSLDDSREPVEDTIKTHIFESLDNIEPRIRSDSDTLKINAAFDNFLTTNKLLKK